MSIAILIGVFVIPFAWSAVVAIALRAPTDVPPTEPQVRQRLALMILPTPIGIACVAGALLLPVPAPAMQTLRQAWRIAATSGNPAFAEPVTHSWAGLSSGGAWTILGLYAVGFTFAAFRLLRAQRRLHRIALQATPAPRMGQQVVLTSLPITPFATTDRRTVIPRCLVDRLSAPQLALIVAHEHTHILRHDPAYFTGLAWTEAVFWFNPFLRRQCERCRLAAELAVDDAVLNDAPASRKPYAAALIEALKCTASPPACAPVFCSPSSGDIKMRIQLIIRPFTMPPRRRWPVILLALFLAPMALLQWSYAETGAGTSARFTVTPLKGHITSHFGEQPSAKNGRPQRHRGVDIKAPHGTEIVAPAAGRVTGVQRNYKAYGHLLTIAHKDGFVTRYAHLSAFEVEVGDVVRAGAPIGRVGSTGKSTGPHLHFEVLKDGKHIDPADVAPLPVSQKGN